MTAIYAAHPYDDLADSLAQKRIDIDSDTIKCLLMATYTPDTSHTFLDEVKAAGTEASGTGYTAGGVTLTSVTWTKTAGVWALKGTIPAWNAAGGSLTARYAVFYDASPGTDATNPVLCYWDLANNTNVTATNNTFTLTQHADGIITVDAV